MPLYNIRYKTLFDYYYQIISFESFLTNSCLHYNFTPSHTAQYKMHQLAMALVCYPSS